LFLFLERKEKWRERDKRKERGKRKKGTLFHGLLMKDELQKKHYEKAKESKKVSKKNTQGKEGWIYRENRN
jgi:hypothetical protein